MEDYESTNGNDELLKELGLLTDGEPLKKRRLPDYKTLKFFDYEQCFAYYAFAINKSWLDNVAIALRYDAISPNCNGKLNEMGEYVIEPYRQRITAGFTMIFIEKPCRAGIRINYEKNFFHDNLDIKEDRLILELIAHI